jgi:NAD(P)-dependent dehydrogenase (short-subunit alcohol dehydrogenase family)
MMQKTVLITGVLGGIGSGLAAAFLESGYRVIGLDIRETSPEDCDLFLHFDLNRYCEEAAYRSTMNQQFETHIPELDVLINNAAVQLLDSVDEMLLEDWNQTMNVNLTGPMLLSKYFLPKLEKTRGCIINIASIHQEQTKKRFVAYATSKSALVGLTKAMSVDLQGRVRVNAISPAAIDTPMLHEGFGHDSDLVRQLHELHPLQRIGKPAEVSKLALLLAEDGLGFINGANIQIDGGISNVLHDLK